MLAVVFIVTLLLGIYIMAIAPIKNGSSDISSDPEYRKEYAKSPLFWIFVIIASIFLAFVSVGNCAGDNR